MKNCVLARSSAEKGATIAIAVVEVLQAPGAIDKSSVLGLPGSFTVQCPKSIHDVFKVHHPCRRGAAVFRRGFDSAGVGRPRREDGAFLLNRHIRIADDIHGSPERPGRVKKTIEFEVLSVSFFSHCLIPKVSDMGDRGLPPRPDR